MKSVLKATVLMTALAMAGSVSAATFDFDAETDERGGQPLSFSVDGIGLNASGYTDDGSAYNPDAYAYLDAGNMSGLGVCKVLRGPTGNDYAGGQNECNPSSDDNLLGSEEALGLQFSANVTVNSLSMWGNHVELADQTNVWLYANGAWDSYSLIGGALQGLNLVLGDGLLGLTLDRGVQGYLSMIDVSAPREVPVPGTLALLGLGLAGLGLVRRKTAA